MSPILDPNQARAGRDQLVEQGYTIIPGLLADPLLSEFQCWSQRVFDTVPVDPKYRYQGSDIHVYTPRLWEKMDAEPDQKHFADPIVEKIIDYAPQKQACAELGLENLQPRDNMTIHYESVCGHQRSTCRISNAADVASEVPMRCSTSSDFACT